MNQKNLNHLCYNLGRILNVFIEKSTMSIESPSGHDFKLLGKILFYALILPAFFITFGRD